MPTSYNSVTEATTYFNSRYDSDEWTQASEQNREKVLKTAARYINRLNYQGDKKDASQEHEFPRGADTVAPQAIKDAECEIALALLKGRDVEFEAEHRGQESTALGGMRTRKTSEYIPDEKIHGIPSTIAWGLLKPFLRDPRQITLKRVS